MHFSIWTQLTQAREPAHVPDHVTLTLSNGETITIPWRRSARARNIRLQVLGGVIRVSSPPRVALHTVESFVLQQRAWIEAHWQKSGHLPPNVLHYLGRAYRLELVDKFLKIDGAGIGNVGPGGEAGNGTGGDGMGGGGGMGSGGGIGGGIGGGSSMGGGRIGGGDGGIDMGDMSVIGNLQGGKHERIVVHEEKNTISIFPITPTADSVTKSLERWLQTQASVQAVSLLQEVAPQMGVAVPQLRFKDMRSRWGSCSHRGVVTLNWRLMHTPLVVMRYVVVHELAHRKHMDHSRHFWELVGKYDPDFRVHRGWLKRNSHLCRTPEILI